MSKVTKTQTRRKEKWTRESMIPKVLKKSVHTDEKSIVGDPRQGRQAGRSPSPKKTIHGFTARPTSYGDQTMLGHSTRIKATRSAASILHRNARHQSFRIFLAGVRGILALMERMVPLLFRWVTAFLRAGISLRTVKNILARYQDTTDLT